MRVTLEIDDEKMKAILSLAHQEKNATALALALDDYLGFKRRQTFVNRVMAGETEYGRGSSRLAPISYLWSKRIPVMSDGGALVVTASRHT